MQSGACGHGNTMKIPCERGDVGDSCHPKQSIAWLRLPETTVSANFGGVPLILWVLPSFAILETRNVELAQALRALPLPFNNLCRFTKYCHMGSSSNQSCKWPSGMGPCSGF